MATPTRIIITTFSDGSVSYGAEKQVTFLFMKFWRCIKTKTYHDEGYAFTYGIVFRTLEEAQSEIDKFLISDVPQPKRVRPKDPVVVKKEIVKYP